MALISRDLKHVWHPASQMKDYETFNPCHVVGASGAHLHLANGKKIIDAISSWWCKSLGHQHPQLKAALVKQLEQFDHVILANTTNETIVALSERLAGLTQTLTKVMYASDGSSAVEMALKMSLQARQIQGNAKRHLFVALQGGYHGETIGALSVSDLGLYRDAYGPLLFSAYFLKPIPYVSNRFEAAWYDSETHWLILKAQLEPLAEKITAIIIEPIVQGAAGMKIYSADLLKRLNIFARQHGIHLIADEIMTGLGRTGKMLACEHAGIEPDFLCLSKGLTAGMLPLSAMLTHQAMYDLFYDDYEKQKSFLHSHTQSGNVLAAAVACDVLRIINQENLLEKVIKLETIMLDMMHDIAEETGCLQNVRGIGAIVAADLICHPSQRMGFRVFQEAMTLGAFLRPLGNTIYWLPPFTTDYVTLQELKMITRQAVLTVMRGNNCVG